MFAYIGSIKSDNMCLLILAGELHRYNGTIFNTYALLSKSVENGDKMGPRFCSFTCSDSETFGRIYIEFYIRSLDYT
jgi:hypothetical protein